MPALKFFRGFFLVWILVVALWMAGCSPNQSIRVGLTAELSGKQGEPGVNLRNGVRMAVEEINQAGGIHGQKIELVEEDDLGTAEGAQAAENKLIDKNVVAVIGHFTSNQTLAGYQVTQQRGVLLLSATASTSELSAKQDLFFRTVVSTDAMGEGFARYIYQKRALQRIAVVYDLDNRSYAEPMSQTFSATFTQLGGQIAGQASFSEKNSPDFTAFVNQIYGMNPDGVLIIASPGSTALLAQYIRLKNWMVPLFSSSWGQGETLIQNGGRAVEGMEFIIALDVNDPAPRLQTFKTNYQKLYSREPIFSAIEGYETMQLLAKALETTGGQAKGLDAALLSIHNFVGLTGPIGMDPYGDAVRQLYIQKLQDKKFETILVLDSNP